MERTSYGRNGGPVDREGGGLTQNRHYTRYCSSPPSTSSSLHGLPSTSSSLHELLFIQPPPRATPPTTVQPALSTGSYSTTPPWFTIHQALHRLLFIQPSTGWSCSSRPPRGPIHPAPTGSIDRGPVHPEATPPLTVHPPPPPAQRSLFIQRGSIDQLQLATVAKELPDMVQLIVIDRSLGFGNA